MSRRVIFIDRPIVYAEKQYGFFAFLFDCIMLVLTCGLWAIWIFCREMRKR